MWVRMWRFNNEGRSNDFPHSEHGNMVRSLRLIGDDTGGVIDGEVGGVVNRLLIKCGDKREGNVEKYAGKCGEGDVGGESTDLDGDGVVLIGSEGDIGDLVKDFDRSRGDSAMIESIVRLYKEDRSS